MQHDTILARHDTSLLDALAAQPADPMLSLIGAFRGDPRTDKIDLGVGVYRDPSGRTPVLRAVKAAERRLHETQDSKAYLGGEGDVAFFAALTRILLGTDAIGGAYQGRVAGLQTVGGTGALRLAADLVARARPGGRIWIGNPTWPNHPPVFQAAGLTIVPYQHYDVAAQQLNFDALLEALGQAEAGDVALLHACCHNPTGADFSLDQWTAIAKLLAKRGVLPLIDMAYQGLGDGLDADAAGTRIVLDEVGEALITYSCNKNFGLYRDRVGALVAVTCDGAQAGIVQSNLLAIARANWSMPPDHGAALVRIILEDDALTADWRAELDEMGARLRDIRAMLGAAHPRLAPIGRQHGMFSMLPLTPDQVAALRADHGIYMLSSGRISVAGLQTETVPTLVAALQPYL